MSRCAEHRCIADATGAVHVPPPLPREYAVCDDHLEAVVDGNAMTFRAPEGLLLGYAAGQLRPGPLPEAVTTDADHRMP